MPRLALWSFPSSSSISRACFYPDTAGVFLLFSLVFVQVADLGRNDLPRLWADLLTEMRYVDQVLFRIVGQCYLALIQ